MNITDKITKIDIFKRKQEDGKWIWDTGIFVGRPYKLSYREASVLMADAWKEKALGIPQGCFLLAYYDCDPDKTGLQEALLLRVIEPSELPTDRDMVSSMVEYYKDFIRTGSDKQSQLDQYSRYEFGFSGVRCRVLGCFYLDESGKAVFGADVENFYSAHNYSVIKPSEEFLNQIVNYRSSGIPGGEGDIRIGKVRYSSSMRFGNLTPDVPMYVKAKDFSGKRTALFGMTRTGKSNTIKKIIQANEQMSALSKMILDKQIESPEEALQPFNGEAPKYPVGQIIFDINGEYANANLQDEGTAIFELYKEKTERYSIVEKKDFKVLKVNFYNEIDAGFELIRAYPPISDDSAKYMANFRAVNLDKPEDYSSNHSAQTRYDRRVAAYKCMLHLAGLKPPADKAKVYFEVAAELRAEIDPKIDPSTGITLEQAANWWEKLWKSYATSQFCTTYKKNKGREWADDDLKAILVMLTRCREAGGNADCTGYRVIRGIEPQHTSVAQAPFEEDILSSLRSGKIVIVDLSSGDEDLQRMYSERITRRIFRDAMTRFTSTRPNNFIQFYFEEAHNLFPKKDDRDLSQIYNRLAKEGAKLHLGLVYATQEVSSVSSSILKATQNWFISHLNNEDEIRELRKYYDFSDFSDSLIKFSQDTDKGFARVKTYSNAFVVPVQIDKFTVNTEVTK
ncbi:Helicase HerA central domain-containing protein [Chromobacterium violaceum]|uniref:ATP-binding protein n=1 Tax=Chromobacterium violaceum TaxID=536 RepID=UPI003CF3EAE2